MDSLTTFVSLCDVTLDNDGLIDRLSIVEYPTVENADVQLIVNVSVTFIVMLRQTLADGLITTVESSGLELTVSVSVTVTSVERALPLNCEDTRTDDSISDIDVGHTHRGHDVLLTISDTNEDEDNHATDDDGEMLDSGHALRKCELLII